MKLRRALLCAYLLPLLVGTTANAVTIDWTTVGNPGNATDPLTFNHYGRVDYAYDIGKFEVTNAQYTEFLNTKDRLGTNRLELFPVVTIGTSNSIHQNFAAAPGNKYTTVAGKENQPVASVSWSSAARFANWLNNGQGNGDTETGAYTLNPSDPFAQGVVRNPGAKIVLPSADEWYKAAYYDPTTQSYFKYATSNNTPPANVPPPGGTNSANYLNAVGQVTDVGAYTVSPSPYGTFDQSGNVYEWMETSFASSSRLIGGGAYHSPDFFLSPLMFPHDFPPNYLQNDLGFRVASVPEPSALCSLCVGIACSCFSLRKRLKIASERASRQLPLGAFCIRASFCRPRRGKILSRGLSFALFKNQMRHASRRRLARSSTGVTDPGGILAISRH